MLNTQSYVELFSGLNTQMVLHRLMAMQTATTAPLASKIPITKGPTLGLSADHRYQFRIRQWADISTTAGATSGGVGTIGAGMAHLKAFARMTKLVAGVDDEYETILAAINGDTAILEDKTGARSPEDYLRLLLTNKAYGLTHHYLFQVYRGDIFNYADDDSTYGYGYGGDELVDGDGFLCRGCIAFAYVPSGENDVVIDTVAAGGTTITFNDHMDATGTNYGRVGAYYLKPGMLLTVRARTDAGIYSLVQDADSNTAVLRVLAVVHGGAGDSRYPYQAVLGSITGETVTLAAGGSYYFTLASMDYEGEVQDSWYAHTLPISYAAEAGGMLHYLNRALDVYSFYRGYSVAYDSADTIYETVANLLATMKARHQATGPRDIAVFCDPYYIEVMRQEVANAAMMVLDLSGSSVVGDPWGKINSIEIDGVPVIPDPYVGPGIILIRCVPPTRAIKDNPVEVQYMPPAGAAFTLPEDSDAATFKGVRVPPMMAWMEEGGGGALKGTFLRKVEGHDQAFNYAVGWFGLVHFDPSTLGKIYGIGNVVIPGL